MNKAALQLKKILRELKELEGFQAATQKYIRDTFGLYYYIRKAPLNTFLLNQAPLFKYTDRNGDTYYILDNDFKTDYFEADLYQKNLKIIATQSDLLDKTTASIKKLKNKALQICDIITDADLKEAEDYEKEQKFDLHYQYRQLTLKKLSMQDVLGKKYELIYQKHICDDSANLVGEQVIYSQQIDNQLCYFLKDDYLPKSQGFIDFTKELIASEQHIIDTINQKLTLLDDLIHANHQVER